MSVRSLNRRFREQTGTTPLQWLIRARVRRAQQLLETTSHSVEHIATHVGFASATALREHFHRMIDTNPAAYRLAFRPDQAPPPRSDRKPIKRCRVGAPLALPPNMRAHL
jgi:transcriptional regulator GlxA family with amidase domain